MKVLTATQFTQGDRDNDFHFAEEGELVMFVSECDGEEVDGRCGCRRCLGGVKTGKPTTTFMVSNRDITRAQVIEQIKQRLLDGGWGKYSTDEEMVEWATGDADELLRMAAFFRVGEVVEKRGNKFQPRVPAAMGAVN